MNNMSNPAIALAVAVSAIIIGAAVLAIIGLSSSGSSSPSVSNAVVSGTSAASSDSQTSGSPSNPTAQLTEAPTPTPQPTPYLADWSAGLNGWTGTDDWKVVAGVLLNDGTNYGGELLAPYFPSDPDYAVEAEIQLVRSDQFCDWSWGISVRDGYKVGSTCSHVFISNGDPDFRDQDIASAPRTADKDSFHTFRVEVVANKITLSIDGIPTLEATDNSYLEAGRVGLFSTVNQISVRAVRIDPLN